MKMQMRRATKKVTLSNQEVFDMIDSLPGIRNRRAGLAYAICKILKRAGIKNLPQWFDMDRKTANKTLKDLGLS